jgi:hypothetical protein
MCASSRDTTKAGLDRYVQLLRGQAPHERLAQAMRLSQTVRTLALADLESRHPGASADELRARLAVRLYGRDIALRMYPFLPDDAR